MKKNLLSLAIICLGLQVPAQTILSEDFQSGSMPAGWSQTTLATDGGWKFGPASAHQSWEVYFQTTYPVGASKFAFTNDDKCYCNKSADRLISPAMNWSSYSKVFISFDFWYFPVVKSQTYATIEVSTDGGSTWTQEFEISSWENPLWLNQMVDLSAYAGQSNVRVSFKYNDNGQNWKGLGIDNVRIFSPYANDASGNVVMLSSDSKLPVLNMIKQGMDSICIGFTNRGTATITSLELSYRVNGGTVQTQTLSGLNIPSMGIDTLTHPIAWNFNTIGKSDIKAWISKVNGNADQYSANDTAYYSTGVCASTVQRKLVFEEFTNAGCSPCASVNPDYLVVMNQNTAKAVEIAYHTYWPSISDPMYQFNIPDNTTRRNYYHVGGVPYGNVMGNWLYYFWNPLLTWSDVTLQKRIDYHYPRPGFFTLGINATYNGSSIDISGNYASLAGFINGNFSLKVVLVETLSYATAPGPNGEKYFPNAMRKMFPSANGTSLGLPTTSTSGNFSFSYTTYVADSVKPANCKAVVFIQNDDTKHIYQVAWTNLTPTGIAEANGKITGLSIYPNPFNNTISIGNLDEEADIRLYSLQGKEVMSEHITGAATLGTENLASGIYFLNVKTKGESFNYKVVKGNRD